MAKQAEDEMRLTRHAEQRAVQRYLPPDVLRVVNAYGSPVHVRGALSLTLDRTAIDLASEDNGKMRSKLERYRGAYVIIGDEGFVLTAARQRRRFHR